MQLLYLGLTVSAGQSGAAPSPFGSDFAFTVATTAPDETFTIPCQNVGTFNAEVDWGDGSTSTITTYNDADLSHVYSTPGDHQIRISGSFPNIRFNNGGHRLKVKSIDQIGDVGWLTFLSAFLGCANITSVSAGVCDTSAVTSMQQMFSGCSSIATMDLAGFSTAACTSTNSMFLNCSSLTALDASGFDMSSVTNMANMFKDCSSLTTLNVSGWDTTAATSMEGLFYNCSSLTALDVTSFTTTIVTTMASMFRGCTNLATLDVSGFDTSALTSMFYMFNACAALTTLDLTGFDISGVTSFVNFLQSTTISTASYDAILIAWDAQDPVNSLTVHFGSATYTAGGAAATARASLISNDSWTIIDGGTA